MSENATKPLPTRQVIYKEEEFVLMIELIESGLWKTSNLASVLNLDRETVSDWKKRKECIDARRKTITRFLKKRTDAEKILKELEVETDPDKQDITTIIVKGLEFLQR